MEGERDFSLSRRNYIRRREWIIRKLRLFFKDLDRRIFEADSMQEYNLCQKFRRHAMDRCFPNQCSLSKLMRMTAIMDRIKSISEEVEEGEADLNYQLKNCFIEE